MKTYLVTPHYNHLCGMVPMRGLKICSDRDVTKIISELSFLAQLFSKKRQGIVIGLSSLAASTLVPLCKLCKNFDIF